ncbi:M10 family metallopeptidase C-terminal domain-containing protein, partial [Ferrovibrio sp. MS7]|uniref:M10 family metallopeptidase C-terminal domain-containing protein n=1 Tax=Ferrovibrio plantarum TaxID=3119164 RepID=UPI0031371B7F
MDGILNQTSQLYWNYSSALGTGVTLTYSFMTSVPTRYAQLDAQPGSDGDYVSTVSTGFSAFTTAQRNVVSQIFALIAEVTNIIFTEVNFNPNAKSSISFGNFNIDATALAGAAAFAFYPNSQPVGGDIDVGGDIFVDNDYTNSSYTGTAFQKYSYLTILHEVGHALGLKHPGNYNGLEEGPFLPSNLDNNQYTVMSYYDHPSYTYEGGNYQAPLTPMLLDIAALQLVYGANASTRSGNTIYDATWFTKDVIRTLWDAGGTDTIDLTGLSGSNTINLNAGSFSSIYTSGSNNIAIAYGANIENAIGGSGNDTITGNTLNNVLTGGAGNDTINGGDGDDTIVFVGGDGTDTVNGGHGVDTIDLSALSSGLTATSKTNIAGHSISNVEYLIGTAYADNFKNTGSIYIYGRGGDDTYYRSTGGTILSSAVAGEFHGGDGFDTVDFSLATTALNIFSSYDALSGLEIERIVGTAYDDVLTGIATVYNAGAGNDIIKGHGGNQKIYGEAGNDILYAYFETRGEQAGKYDNNAKDLLDGGDGDDILVVSGGTHTLIGGAGTDTIDYSPVSNNIYVDLSAGTGSGGTNTTLTQIISGVENIVGSFGSDFIFGDASANHLIGNSGNDELRGEAGNDILYGGNGDDILRGGAGADIMDGGAGIDTASYQAAMAGVIVSLLDCKGTGGEAAGDSLLSFENLRGSAYADTLIGDANANYIDGGTGADSIDGGAGNDVAGYTRSVAAITINLTTGTGHGGDAEGDTLLRIEGVVGSAFDDSITGSAGADSLLGDVGHDHFNGAAGADYIDGGAGNDTIYYSASLAGVTINLGTGTGIGGDAQGDTLVSIERVFGSGFDDTLTGSSSGEYLAGDIGNDTLIGGAGADYLDGGSGSDSIKYTGSAAAVSINLGTGTGSGGDAQGDILVSIEWVYGSAFDDSLVGSAGNDYLYGETGHDHFNGSAGADYIDGGAGNDSVYYSASSAGVTINLTTGTGLGGDAQGDTLVGIERVYGSASDDSLTGSAAAELLIGGDGNDHFNGAAGADYIDGGAGIDTVYYSASAAGVTINLTTGTGLGGDAQGDTLVGIERVYGSASDDSLTGSAAAELLVGGGGHDHFNGSAGADYIDGGAGNDSVYYSASSAGVTINLTTGTGLGGDAQGDTLVGIERVYGSASDDSL